MKKFYFLFLVHFKENLIIMFYMFLHQLVTNLGEGLRLISRIYSNIIHHLKSIFFILNINDGLRRYSVTAYIKSKYSINKSSFTLNYSSFQLPLYNFFEIFAKNTRSPNFHEFKHVLLSKWIVEHVVERLLLNKVFQNWLARSKDSYCNKATDHVQQYCWTKKRSNRERKISFNKDIIKSRDSWLSIVTPCRHHASVVVTIDFIKSRLTIDPLKKRGTPLQRLKYFKYFLDQGDSSPFK